jgi:hypothetical protein
MGLRMDLEIFAPVSCTRSVKWSPNPISPKFIFYIKSKSLLKPRKIKEGSEGIQAEKYQHLPLRKMKQFSCPS